MPNGTVIDGGLGNDTIQFFPTPGTSGGVNLNFVPEGSDNGITIKNIEKVIGTASDDIFNISHTSGVTFDGNGGNDTLTLTTSRTAATGDAVYVGDPLHAPADATIAENIHTFNIGQGIAGVPEAGNFGESGYFIVEQLGNTFSPAIDVNLFGEEDLFTTLNYHDYGSALNFDLVNGKITDGSGNADTILINPVSIVGTDHGDTYHLSDVASSTNATINAGILTNGDLPIFSGSGDDTFYFDESFPGNTGNQPVFFGGGNDTVIETGAPATGQDFIFTMPYGVQVSDLSYQAVNVHSTTDAFNNTTWDADVLVTVAGLGTITYKDAIQFTEHGGASPGQDITFGGPVADIATSSGPVQISFTAQGELNEALPMSFTFSTEALNLISLAAPLGFYQGSFGDDHVTLTEGSVYSNFDAYDGNDVVTGNSADNILNGGAGNDILDGADGDDTLNGGEGNDILIGGIGQNILAGGSGDDTYKLVANSMNTITDSEGTNHVVLLDVNSSNFSATFTPDGTLSLYHDNQILFATIDDPSSFADIAFSNGATETMAQVLASAAEVQTASPFDDFIDNSQSTNPVHIDLSSGNDTYIGSAFGDIINGGTGDDDLTGGIGNDVYTFKPGDGSDTIHETGGFDILKISGVTLAELAFTRVGNDLQINYDDTVTIKDFFASDANKVEQIVLDDGSTVDLTTLNLSPSGPQAPVAEADMINANAHNTATGNVLLDNGNGADESLSNMPLHVTPGTFETASGGLVVLGADGNFTYLGPDNTSGTDSFTYTLDDGQGVSSTATVTLFGLTGPTPPPQIETKEINVFSTLQESTSSQEFTPGTMTFPALMERVKLLPVSMIQGADPGNLTLHNDAQVSVNFVTEGAGYKNSLGMYLIGPDGAISDVQMLAENLSGTGSGVFGGGNFNPGQLIANLGTLPAGTELGFFIVADGYDKNNFSCIDTTQGHYEFVNEQTHAAATINDPASQVELVFVSNNGDQTSINGDVWHASVNSLNTDGQIHAVSGIGSDGSLEIGFEDLNGLGDADYNDVVIEVHMTGATTVTMPDQLVAQSFTLHTAATDSIDSATVNFTAGHQAGDALKISGFTIDSHGLLNGTNITATQNADGSLSLTGNDTAAHYQSVLQELTLGSTAQTPLAGERDLSITVNDHNGLSDTSAVHAIVGNPGDTAPAGFDPAPDHSTLQVSLDDSYFQQAFVSGITDGQDIALGQGMAVSHEGGYADLRGFDLAPYQTIDMTNGSAHDGVILDINDILDTGSAQPLTIKGDAGDGVALVGGTVTNLGDQHIGNDTFTLFAVAMGQHTAHLLVQDDLALTAATTVQHA